MAGGIGRPPRDELLRHELQPPDNVVEGIVSKQKGKDQRRIDIVQGRVGLVRTQALLTIAIVDRAELLVSQHLVGLPDFLKFFLGLLGGVLVGVPFSRLDVIRALDFGFGSIDRDAQYIVILCFLHFFAGRRRRRRRRRHRLSGGSLVRCFLGRFQNVVVVVRNVREAFFFLDEIIDHPLVLDAVESFSLGLVDGVIHPGCGHGTATHKG
mmetsp:Transcript_13823/g.38885  ORF Transcript_13823/g.38885 Transcript_13823/m.38885 type:complete len:210 (+) Transcript_13823:792-1421(+)